MKKFKTIPSSNQQKNLSKFHNPIPTISFPRKNEGKSKQRNSKAMKRCLIVQTNLAYRRQTNQNRWPWVWHPHQYSRRGSSRAWDLYAWRQESDKPQQHPQWSWSNERLGAHCSGPFEWYDRRAHPQRRAPWPSGRRRSPRRWLWFGRHGGVRRGDAWSESLAKRRRSLLCTPVSALEWICMRSECLRICACTGTLCRTAPDPVFSLSDTPPSVLVLRLEALLLVLMLLSSSSLLSFFLFLILDFKTNLSIIQPKKKTKNKRLHFLFPYLSAVWLPVGWFTFSFSQNIPFRSPTMSLGFVFLSGGTRIPLRAHLPTSQVKALGHRIITVPIFLHTNAFSLQKYKYFILLASLALFLFHFRILFYTPSFRAGLIVFLGNAYSLFALKFKC